jgi:hypothetical protein
VTTDKWDFTDPDLEPLLRERLEGHRITKVSDDGELLVLDDGTRLRLYESDADCCAHAHGRWVVQPDKLDAMITKVEVKPDLENSGDDGDGTTNYVSIVLLHNQNPVALAECSANDGNGGYYYSILSLEVSHIIGTSKWDRSLRVVDA